MKKAWGAIKAILKSDAAAVVMGLALAYGYIKLSIKLMDCMIGAGP